MFIHSIYAVNEQRFLQYIGKTGWLAQLPNFADTLLKTTILDKKLTNKFGNDNYTAPSLQKVSKRHFPAQEHRLIRKIGAAVD